MWEKNHSAFVSDLVFLNDASLDIILEIVYEFVHCTDVCYLRMFQQQ